MNGFAPAAYIARRKSGPLIAPVPCSPLGANAPPTTFIDGRAASIAS